MAEKALLSASFCLSFALPYSDYRVQLGKALGYILTRIDSIDNRERYRCVLFQAALYTRRLIVPETKIRQVSGHICRRDGLRVYVVYRESNGGDGIAKCFF